MNRTINVMQNLDVPHIQWMNQLDTLIEEYRRKAQYAQTAYNAIRPFLGDILPYGLKELLQKAGDEGELSLPDDISFYAKHGIYLNEKFARKRIEENKWAAASGIFNEMDYATRMTNYLANNVVPAALNDGRIKISFSDTSKGRILNIDNFTLNSTEEKVAEDLLRVAVREGAKNISGTSGMKNLKTLTSITPLINVYDIGGEKTLEDIKVSLGLKFHYGSQSKDGMFREIVIQNKETDKYKNKPYYAIFKHQDVISLSEVIETINKAVNGIDFFRLNNKVYYTYEILINIKNEINAFINKPNPDYEGLLKFLGGR